MSQFMKRTKSLKNIPVQLGAGFVATQGYPAYVDKAAFVAKPGATGNTNLEFIGYFAETVDNSGGGSPVPVMVELIKEIWAGYIPSVTGGSAVTLANSLYGLCYVGGPNSVTTDNTQATAGRVWDVDPVKGVLVQPIEPSGL